MTKIHKVLAKINNYEGMRVLAYFASLLVNFGVSIWAFGFLKKYSPAPDVLMWCGVTLMLFAMAISLFLGGKSYKEILENDELE